MRVTGFETMLMKWTPLAFAVLLACSVTRAQPLPVEPGPPATRAYVLSPCDVVLVKVYQEDDLETKMRIGKDGTSSFPLIGVVVLGGKTVEEAAATIRDALAKDFLVNPQVSVAVIDYAKRRFTVLGQVQKPGTYEIPNEESVSLLQAVAMAGGYTRLASKSNVSVSRIVAGQRTSFNLDGNSNAKGGRPFEILPDDTITIGERIF
jgi:polysaccharide export outer membrane protein